MSCRPSLCRLNRRDGYAYPKHDAVERKEADICRPAPSDVNSASAYTGQLLSARVCYHQPKKERRIRRRKILSHARQITGAYPVTGNLAFALLQINAADHRRCCDREDTATGKWQRGP